jgi:hypothetical protein
MRSTPGVINFHSLQKGSLSLSICARRHCRILQSHSAVIIQVFFTARVSQQHQAVHRALSMCIMKGAQSAALLFTYPNDNRPRAANLLMRLVCVYAISDLHCAHAPTPFSWPATNAISAAILKIFPCHFCVKVSLPNN